MITKSLISIPAMLLVFGLASAAVGQTTERVSVDSAGTEANGASIGQAISADGRFVAFFSDASNLVAGDTNSRADVFVHDRQTGATERVSVDSLGAEGNSDSTDTSISADGRFVVFASSASNLVSGDTNATSDVFVRDRQTGATTRVSVDSTGTQGNYFSGGPSISADGRFAAFRSIADNLVAGDTNGRDDVFVRDRQTGETTRASVDSAGAQGNGGSYSASISADGRFVGFTSSSSNLVSGDTNGRSDVFVRDRQTGATTRVSVTSTGAQGNFISSQQSISADGRFVAFESGASDLVADDTNATTDVFVRDRQIGTTTRVSVDSAGAEAEFNFSSRFPSISADGRFVTFHSFARNLVSGDTNGASDVFVHDRQMGATTRVSINSAGVEGNPNSKFPFISAHGRFVGFTSSADNLVAGDTNNAFDVFVHDRGPSNQPPSSRPSPPAALRLGPR